ncbi:single-stranded DNA-binding protein [Paenarthrobacter sp. Z7-10]|uniref:single-stranded DNA-binding protein n=1 Tax=Paenarthrobacter sp. Z7-10 TaxID=2787635 RepID=UPI0022A946ED|nr:single-stranded DNA-binding protein [Paenarthrobacter sp. Z7-10]MCZ2404976.1 single-stranded DNA-binding protein [Paenarthrobacter sp. Z7-10]
MTDMIAVHGFVANDVRLFVTEEGLTIASFRVGSTERKFDRTANAWVDSETNWYNVSSFRYLAQNVAFCIKKGDPVVVTGKLRLRQWTNEAGKSGMTADIDADAVGHDLTWGTDRFTRSSAQRRDAAAAGREAGQPESDPLEVDGHQNDDGGESGIAVSLDGGEELVDVATGELLAAD